MNSPTTAPQESQLDEFGMDRDYIESFSKTLFHFLCKYYWRIETRGLEHIPLHGGTVLAGTHRGFMPWDAVMTLHLIVRNTGRVPRFLCHPGLLKFPLVSNVITRLGGVLACQENADRILAADEILGVLPEGVEGAFSLYRDAYKLASFGRDDFVKMALRHRVPIVPFVIVVARNDRSICDRHAERIYRGLRGRRSVGADCIRPHPRRFLNEDWRVDPEFRSATFRLRMLAWYSIHFETKRDCNGQDVFEDNN